MSHADDPTDRMLEAFLDEELPSEEMGRLEELIRKSPPLLQRLAACSARRDSGVHTLGAIWRRHQLTCLSREALANFLMGILPDAEAEYVKFHLEVVRCRICQANHVDLVRQGHEPREIPAGRKKKYFQSSAGLLQRK